MSELVAAIDQGTTSTRCVLFDSEGREVALAQREHRQLLPRPGWVEHDAHEIWEATQAVVREALARAGRRGAELAAVGITNQRETLVVWDPRTGKPLANAIVWQDTRTQALVEELGRAGGPDRWRARTGLPLATYFSGPKLAWLLDEVEGLREAALAGRALAGTIDSWLLWNLTGEHATDVTNASRTLLFDIQRLAWDAQILAELGIPPALLPRVAPSIDREAFGRTRADGPFGAELPVAGVLGDQHAALFGQCCFAPGETKNTYGTGCFLLSNTGTKPVRSRAGLLTTLAWQRAGEAPIYALEGSVAVAGALVQWLRDQLGILARSSDVEALARSVPDNGDVYLVPAFSGLFAPHWRADARGIVAGLTRFSTKAHLARAALEATSFQTRDLIEAMRADSGLELPELLVDGGMTKNDLLMQIQADLLGIPVARPAYVETTVLGAAFAAGLATGLYGGEQELLRTRRIERRFEPAIAPGERERMLRGWSKALERSLGWVEERGG